MADPLYSDRHPYQQNRFIVTADAAAYAAAKAAQVRMIVEMGNPFK